MHVRMVIGRRPAAWWARLCFIASISMAGPAAATVVEPLEITDLAAQSARVIRGQVTARYVLPERGPRGEIYTRTDIRIHEYLVGDGPREITIQQLGGRLGDLRLVLSGNARLEPGTEVLAFLDYDPDRRLHYVVGLAQGVFQIDRTGPAATIHRDLEGLSFYVVGAPPSPQLRQERTLSEILALLRPSADLAPPVLDRGGVQ